ncbi:GNAT family N-acetyltransferase [Streptomyces sp. NPDC054854]
MITSSKDDYEVSTDPDRLDIDSIHHWLSTDAFWALGRSRETVERSVRGSLNFGAYDAAGAQVAYARVVTDLATFAWLCDVYVAPAHRGRGLGTRLAGAVLDHLAPHRLKRVLLSTLDAHDVYAKAGFVPFPDPEKLMIWTPEAAGEVPTDATGHTGPESPPPGNH